MRTVLLAIAASALLGGLAHAQEKSGATPGAANAAGAQRAAPIGKVLYICDEEERAWRVFSRDLGTPDFITAEQVRADKSKAWREPKCITASELRRLTGTRVGQLTERTTPGN